MDPFTLMLISAGVQAGMGGWQMIKSQRELNRLKQQKMPSLLEAMAPYKENQALARKMYEQGLDPTTMRLAQQQQATEAARNQRYLADVSGGQLSGVASRLGALGTAQTGLGLAQMDVAARQRGMSALTSANLSIGQLQQQDVMNRLNYRMQMEQALGMAKQQGRQNIAGAAGSLGQYAMYDSIYNPPKTPKAPKTIDVSKMPSGGRVQVPKNQITSGKELDLPGYKNTWEG